MARRSEEDEKAEISADGEKRRGGRDQMVGVLRMLVVL
jgi:hypothetical protein